MVRIGRIMGSLLVASSTPCLSWMFGPSGWTGHRSSRGIKRPISTCQPAEVGVVKYVQYRSRREGTAVLLSVQERTVDLSYTTDVDEDLELAFSTLCDPNGTLNLKGFLEFDEVAALMSDDLISRTEVETVWIKVAGSKSATVDLDGFIEAFDSIDELFEDDDEEEPEIEVGSNASIVEETKIEKTFRELAGDLEGTVSLAQVLKWDEIVGLIEEEQLSTSEVTALFQAAPKAPGSTDMLDLTGFVALNDSIDALFEDIDEILPASAVAKSTPAAPLTALEKEFVSLAGSTGSLLSLDQLLQWRTVSKSIRDGEVTENEVRELWKSVSKTASRGGGIAELINLDGFKAFNTAFDDLFEEEEEEKVEKVAIRMPPPPPPAPRKPSMAAELNRVLTPPPVKKEPATANETKMALLELAEEEMDGAGVDTTSETRGQILKAVEKLLAASEREGTNVVSKGLEATEALLDGKWRLMYQSSKSIEFHRGLTGISKVLPQAAFKGVTQTLIRDGDILDSEYTEELGVVNVSVTGDWEVRSTVSPLTGARSVTLDVTTKRVTYGKMSMIGERWKPLRAMGLLDIVYLDSDLRVMRGQASPSTVFILRRED